MSESADLSQLVLPQHLTKHERDTIFQHLMCRLASYRNIGILHAEAANRDASSMQELEQWASLLLSHAWTICHESEQGCPKLDKHANTSTAKLHKLPHPDDLTKVLNSILFLHLTVLRRYSARSRTFLFRFGPVDETVVISTLKSPERAIRRIQEQTDSSTADHAARGKTLRVVGMGVGAVAGGILLGVTGGLAAPLVGAGITTILSWLGVGGTSLGLLASGLASSTAVCGALFGAYGAHSTASMVGRHTREIRDLALVPVKTTRDHETLGVRLCVSGWLACREDVSAPWTVFGGDDTYALQWEVEALEELSDALMTLLKSHAMKYAKTQIIKHTVLANLLSSLTPIMWLKIGQIMDNPWMNSKAQAVKAGAVLGDLLANGVFGSRPVTLIGYSLGSLVLFEALKHLISLPPAISAHLIQDVYLFGTPAPADVETWSRIRSLVSGRLVNGYSSNDYVLAVLSRASDVNWRVAGLEAIDVMGVENMLCEDVDGHTMWRDKVGKWLRECHATGIFSENV